MAEQEIPSKGAMRAAKVIMSHQGDHISTTYGNKSVVGIADLIDRETAAPDLLAGCELLIAWGEVVLKEVGTFPWPHGIEEIREAIAKAKP